MYEHAYIVSWLPTRTGKPGLNIIHNNINCANMREQQAGQQAEIWKENKREGTHKVPFSGPKKGATTMTTNHRSYPSE